MNPQPSLMLRTLPSSALQRHRGAQRGNSNALKHGLYSSRHTSTLSRDRQHLSQLKQASIHAYQSRQIAFLEQQVRYTFDLLIDHFLTTDDPYFQSDTLGKLERFYQTVSLSLRLKRRLKKLRDERDLLPNLAQNALSLCIAEFTDRRISAFAHYSANQNPPPVEPQDLVPQERSGWGAALREDFSALPIVNHQSPIVNRFVPQHLQKNHTIRAPEFLDSSPFTPENPAFPPPSPGPASIVPQPLPGIIGPPSPLTTPHVLPNTDLCSLISEDSSPYFPLTPPQQALLVPILASLRSQLESMAIRVRKQSCSDLFLLQIILTRLAFNLRWIDLPAGLPLRACQLLYKHLCTSGRMQLIYRLLYEDLSAKGRINLLEMAHSGVFQCEMGRVYLTAHQPVTWESLTGLLLLQRACLNQRRLQRADYLDKYRPASRQRSSRSLPANSLEAIVRESAGPQPAHWALQRSGQLSHALPSTDLIPVSDTYRTDPIMYGKLKKFNGDFHSSSP